MKKLLIFGAFILLAFPTLAQKKGHLSDFHWLVGTWKNTKSGAYESWSYDEHKDYISGIGYKVEKGDTTILETLAIEYQKGSFYYMADVPENGNPVLFKIIVKEKESFTAENPQHDFPKRISYASKGRKKLQATIAGDRRSVSFDFEQVK